MLDFELLRSQGVDDDMARPAHLDLQVAGSDGGGVDRSCAYEIQGSQLPDLQAVHARRSRPAGCQLVAEPLQPAAAQADDQPPLADFGLDPSDQLRPRFNAETLDLALLDG